MRSKNLIAKAEADKLKVDWPVPAPHRTPFSDISKVIRVILGDNFGAEASTAEWHEEKQCFDWEERYNGMPIFTAGGSRIQFSRRYAFDPRRDWKSEIARIEAEHERHIQECHAIIAWGTQHVGLSQRYESATDPVARSANKVYQVTISV